MNKIDLLIFEHVYGNEKGYIDFLIETGNTNIINPYSTDVKYALEVAEKMILTITPKWRVFRANTKGSMRDIRYVGTTNNQEWTKHVSLPMAICLAALKLYGIHGLESEADKIVKDIEDRVHKRIEELKELEQRLGSKLD